VVGPHVSVGKNTVIKGAVVKNSIIQTHSVISGGCIDNSMIGNYVNLAAASREFSMGDYTTEQ
jgi:glucose-1-phosphate thymidylyltransferase